MELPELLGRRRLCQLFIDELTRIDDPRREDAMAEYRRQQAELDGQITELTGKPPAVVVGLQSAVLFAKDGRE